MSVEHIYCEYNCIYLSRYGREEMLALYDRNAEAPQELRYNETLYQQRGKQPIALNNTFEDDVVSKQNKINSLFQ